MTTELARHGYDHESSGVVDGEWLYVFPATWRRIAEETEIGEAVACRELHERGALQPPEDAENSDPDPDHPSPDQHGDTATPDADEKAGDAAGCRVCG